MSWKEEGMWTAHAPAVPGVYGLGDTPKEAEDDLVEALELMFEYLDEVGEAHPSPTLVRTSQVRV